jgi:DNA invertase Pin-like site-specific DNA recombinase
MLVGYARVSTTDQNLALQRDALKAAGCRKVFTDQGISGSIFKRPGLDAALDSLKPGDTLLVWKLDRLGRSLAHLVQTISDLGERGINFHSLSDPIDTESAGGRLVLHIMAALAEFERSLNTERTRAGLAAAKRRGRKLGRRRSLTHAQLALASELIEKGEARSLVAENLGVARSTLFVSLRRAEIESALLSRRRSDGKKRLHNR